MLELTPLDEVGSALGLGDRELISIVGGGGKTTTLFSLGRQLAGRVVLTTTTKMGSERTEGVEVLLSPDHQALASAFTRTNQVLVWSDRAGHRADGVTPELCEEWFRDGHADHVVIEADGSRRRPFKAPYPYEPVIPSATTFVVACIGAQALGMPIDEACLRPDAVVNIVGGAVDDALTPAAAAQVLLSDVGSRKAVPGAARFAVAIHQITDERHQAAAALVAALGDVVPVICLGAVNG